MDKEFHYYITGIVAHRAGFSEEDAAVIAYATQYVDDNNQIIEVKDADSGETYQNYISQTMNILQPQDALIRIYPIFHFIPGRPAAATAHRGDGLMHLLNTTPDSPVANAMMHAAFSAQPEESRLYRIGIAAHAYADTWAHQNFVGLKSRFNHRKGKLLPNIGHADALHHPDWVAHRWKEDPLVDGDIDNNQRFLAAAQRLFEHCAEYTSTAASWDDLRQDLIHAMGLSRGGKRNRGQRARMQRYTTLAPWLPTYRETTWRDQAIHTNVRGRRDEPHGIFPSLNVLKDSHAWRKNIDKTTTHWYQFQLAVKAHQAELLPKMSRICQRMGLDIRATYVG